MSATNNTVRGLCFFALATLVSCASVRVKEVNSAAARTGDCELPVFKNVSEINGAYEVLCELETVTGSALYLKRTAEAAIERGKPAACRCGADALLVVSSGRTKVKLFSWRRGTATVQAIKTTNSASL